MTDKVRIDTLRANSLTQTNDTFLARQAEFESNVRSYPRKLPLAIAKAQGVWITDVENNQYLDCLAGAGTLALGHNHPDVLQSIQRIVCKFSVKLVIDTIKCKRVIFSNLKPFKNVFYILIPCFSSFCPLQLVNLLIKKSIISLEENIFAFRGSFKFFVKYFF